MNKYCTYNDAGVILEVRTESNPVIPCEDHVADDTHYVDLSGAEPEIRGRMAMTVEPIQDGLSVVFIELPAGVEVQAGGVTAVTGGGPFEIEFDVPGTYLIQFRPPPQFLDTELEVTVG